MGEDLKSNPKMVDIPVVGVSKSIGQKLRKLIRSDLMLYNLMEYGLYFLSEGYERRSGTSMA